MASLFTDGKFQGFDSSGNPLSAGKLYSYAAGTTTPLATYTTQSGGVSNANPVILDSSGRASVWVGAAAYRMILKDSADVTIWDVDNISGDLIGSTTSASTGAGQVGSLWTLNYAARTVGNDLRYGSAPSIFKVLSDAQQADVLAYTYSLDLTSTIAAAFLLCKAWYFPAGGYKISTLEFTANGQRIVGDSPSTTIINSTATALGASAIKSSDQTVARLFCSLENLQIVASGLTAGYVVDWKSMQFGRLHNVWLFGGGASCVGLQLKANWATTECTYNSIVNCYIGGVGNGITFGDGANTNTLIGNRIQPMAGGYGYFLSGTATGRVSNNTITGGGVEYAGAVSRGVYAGLGVDVLTITGTRFEFLAVGIESTVQANGLVLLGNYFSSNTADYALNGTNTTRVEPYGIELPNAAASSTTGLDYYKRDTFAPTVIGTTAAGVGTYVVQAGSYTRIGNRVFFELQVQISAHTGTGNIRVAALPFTQKNQALQYSYTIATEALAYAGAVRAVGVPNTAEIAIYSEVSGSPLAAVAMDAACNFIISGSYPV